LVPGLKFSNEVPPTAVTHGWEGGSMRLRMVVRSERMQPKAPVSPSPPNTACPCAAICRKMVFSAWT
jgi:hypothetical protein